MNTPDQTLKLQTQLSAWSGTQKIAGWLTVLAVALCAIAGILLFTGAERSVVVLGAPFFLIVTCLLLRTQAKKKIGEIEAKLSP